VLAPGEYLCVAAGVSNGDWLINIARRIESSVWRPHTEPIYQLSPGALCCEPGSAVKLKFHGSSFLVASSWHTRPTRANPREVATRIRATFPFSLLRTYLIGRPAVRCGVVLPVCPCVSFSKFHEHDTHDLLRTSRCSIFVRHVRFPRDMLATSSRGCHEETIPVDFQLNGPILNWLRTPTSAVVMRSNVDIIGNGIDKGPFTLRYGADPCIHVVLVRTDVTSWCIGLQAAVGHPTTNCNPNPNHKP